MSTLINRTEEIDKELEKEGKIRLMTTPEDIANIKAVDELMKNITDSYKIKEINSWIGAGNCYVSQNSN